MWSWIRHKFVLTFSLVIVGGLGFWNIYQAEAQSMTGEGDYIVANSNLTIATEPGNTIPVVLAVRNLTDQTWMPEQLRLGTIFTTGDHDRPSVWQTETWLSATRIAPIEGSKPINPNQSAMFSFTMKAPIYQGIYQENFVPVLEGNRWLSGTPIVITIQVGSGAQVWAAAPGFRELKIYRSTQQINWLENGVVVATLPISTGKVGYTTPAGNYKIINQFEEAYSSKYSLYMGHWMGIAKDGVGFQGYGIHSLAYWKIKHQPYPDGTIKDGRLYINGRVYEDVDHLGTPMSHGCIRQGINEARVLFNWASVGTPVEIV